MFTLEQILGLVGTLDDAPGDDTPRERFRTFLRDSLTSVGAVRDFIEACLREKGPQYDRALQDLVNHTGSLIGFDVEFGRYRGVTNEIGHDGLWRWHDVAFVIEVKTTDAYAIHTASLIGYVDRLISAGRIANWDQALGLYVFGRPSADIRQLANTIVAEKRTHQLRIATVDSLLSLLELVQDSQITPDEAVTLLRPGSVYVEDTVGLLARIASRSVTQSSSPTDLPPSLPGPEPAAQPSPAPGPAEKPFKGMAPARVKSDRVYLLTPVSNEEDASARDTITNLLQAGWYVFGNKTPGRKLLKPGDRLCFYESGVGVVADAEVASVPEQKPPPVTGLVKNLDRFPWRFRIANPHFYFDDPVPVDMDLRSQLEAFAGRDVQKPWAWFVQGTHQVSNHDYALLTRSQVSRHER